VWGWGRKGLGLPILPSCNIILLGGPHRCNEGQDLERTLSWNGVDPVMSVLMRDREGEDTKTQMRRLVQVEAEIKGMYL
jgi:hypothetical protein